MLFASVQLVILLGVVSSQKTFVVYDSQVTSPNFCFSSDWVKTDTSDSSTVQGYCNPSSCGSLGQFLGPMSVTFAFSRAFSNLPAHTSLKVVMDILKVDNIDGETINLDIDSTIYSVGYNLQGIHSSIDGFTFSNEVNAGGSACTFGQVAGDDVSITLEAVIAHTASSVNLNLYVAYLSTDGGWGVRNLKLLLEESCSYPCATCDTLITNCTSCAANSNRAQSPICSCSTGYYDNGVALCAQCPTECATCAKVQSTVDCITCAANRSSAPTCGCADGFYAQQSNCVQCDSKCSKCDSTGCITCAVGRSNAPTCDCPTNTYDNGANICVGCSPKCNGCSQDATNCATCASGRTNAPTCTCGDGTYDDGTQCQSCNYKCATCTNASTCTLCAPSRSITPACNCPAGYYDSGVAQCSVCGYKCLQCTSGDGCTVCKSNRTPTPACNCASGYFENAQQICQQCSPNCKTCTISADNCQSCVLSGVQAPGCGCASNQFSDGVTSGCQNCSAKCSQCTLNKVNCSVCQGIRINLPQCSCPDGYYDDSITCQKCSNKCATCNGAYTCTSCAGNRLNQIPLCNQCPDGYYDNDSNSNCLKCDQSICSSCIGSATNCSVCADSTRQAPQCVCFNNQIVIDGVCQNCSYKCGTCSISTSNCVTCSDPSRSNAPQCSCPALTTDQQGVSQCQSPYDCPYQCSSCGSDLKCVTCSANRVNVPQCGCPSGFKDDGKAQCSSCSLRTPIAQLSDDISKLIITFDVNVELSTFALKGQSPSTTNCLSLTESTQSLLGYQPSCYISQNQFIIVLGFQAQINVGDQVEFNDGVINSLGCNGAIIAQLSVNGPSHPPQPTFDIGYVSQLSKCQPLTVTLQGISNTGNRQYTISYAIKSISPENAASRQALSNTLKTASSSTLLIPPNTFVDSTKYTLSVTVLNFLNQATTKEFIITTLSSVDPQITIVQGGPYRVYQQIIVQALISLSSCGQKATTSSRISIVWSVNNKQYLSQSMNPQSEQTELVFEPYQFQVNDVIRIDIKLTLQTGESASDDFRFTITPSQLIANILGGDRVQGRPQALSLTGIVIDPDQQQSSLKNVTIKWSCEYTNGTNCVEYTFQNDNLQQIIPADVLSSYQSYRFYIKARKADIQTVASVLISVVPEAQSRISVLYPAYSSTQKINPTQENIFILEKNILYNRRRRLLVNSQSTDQAYLTVSVIYGGELQTTFYPDTYVIPIILKQYVPKLHPQTQNVQLKFTYTDPYLNGTTLLTKVNLNINIPPMSGMLQSSPSEGQALATKFLVSLADWIDQDTPLQYKFGYYLSWQQYLADVQTHSYDNMIILSDWNSNNFVQTYLPQGTYNKTTKKYDILLLGMISDSLGGQTEIIKTIQVKPYTIRKRFLADSSSILDDSLQLLGSIINETMKTQSYTSDTIQQIIQLTIQIVQLQSSGCATNCNLNGICVNQTCKCNPGFFLANCIANQDQYQQVLMISSELLALIQDIKKKSSLSQSTEDQLLRLISILMKDKNVAKYQSADQVSNTLDNTESSLSANFYSYSSSDNGNKTLSSLLNTVPDPAKIKRLSQIKSTINSATNTTDKIFTSVAGNNRKAFNSSSQQDQMNKKLMSMSKSSTDFLANASFVDQPPQTFGGANMNIKAQKVSQEVASKYFSTTQYIFYTGLSEAELAELYEATIDANGGVQLSTVTYNTNPYNSDPNFPYPNQTNQMVSPNYKSSNGSQITPKRPLVYQLQSQTTSAPQVCVTETEGTWASAGCSTLKFTSSGIGAATDALSFGGSEEEEEAGSDEQTGCSCEVSTEITVVSDFTGMFTNSNIGALFSPDLLLNFDFWNSAIFYVALVLTIIWILLMIWGWRKDKSDMEKQQYQAQEKQRKEEEEAAKAEAEAKVIITEKDIVLGEKKTDEPEYDSDDETNQKKINANRSVFRQFAYSLPMIHEFLSIFSQYDEESPRPVRFTIYYLKTIIMMAMTSIFGQNLNATQNVIFSLICVALMNPMVAALNAGFRPSAPKWKKIGAILVILISFAISWYVCLVIAAVMGVTKSNAWTQAYAISLIINIVVMETMTIFIQIVATPYIKIHIDSGNLMIRILYFYLFQEEISSIVDSVV